MFFRPRGISKMWDTWMFHHDRRFYLYYLITEHSLGEGVGAATSDDGVHWTDRGRVLDKAAEAVWLGSGSVWRARGARRPGRFLMNYSEWFGGEPDGQQVIRFAASDDLLHWRRLDSLHPFEPDADLYRRGKGMASRWDCISPLLGQSGPGLQGYWTGDPARAEVGFGHGRSEDGLAWRALPPPRIRWGDVEPLPQIEAGAAMVLGGRTWLLASSYRPYRGRSGTWALVADDPAGPFRPAEPFELLASPERTAYFPRVFEMDGQTLVNHHVISADNARAFAPLKTVRVTDDGRELELGWWPGNAQAKGRPLPIATEAEGIDRVTFDHGCWLEVTGAPPGGPFVRVHIGTSKEPTVVVATSSATTVAPRGGTRAVERFAGRADRLRLLVHGGYAELYRDDVLLHCISLAAPASGTVLVERSASADTTVAAWMLDVPPL